MMTYGSLFAGIGGFDFGFDQVGLKCQWQVEIDLVCQNVLRRHWTDVPKFTGIKDVGKRNLSSVDIICGGFPCQDLSIAGKRQGLIGERSNIFFEMLRVVYELQPIYLVWENVPGLLSSCSCRGCRRRCKQCGTSAGTDDQFCEACRGETFGGRVLPGHRGADFFTVISSLGYIGYDGCWTVLDARYFGLAQRRRRLFGMFVRRDIGAERCFKILSFQNRLRGNFEAGRETGQTAAASVKASSPNRCNGGIAKVVGPIPASGAGDARTGNERTEAEMLVLAFGGNNSSGLVGITTSCNAYPSKRYDFESETFIVGSLPAPGRDASDGPDNKLIAATSQSGGNGNIPGSRDDNIFVQAYNWQSGGDVRLSPGLPNLQSNQVPAVGVRRLTPVECCRLQGFPDDWNEWGIGENGNRVEISDSARYRQLGNAVATPIPKWIGKQIIKNHT